MLYCLRCSEAAKEEEAHAGCHGCGEGVFVKSKHHGFADLLTSASVSDKEALLDALEDAIGEETDRDCVVIVDADAIKAEDGAYNTLVTIQDQNESRSIPLEEELALAFLATALR